MQRTKPISGVTVTEVTAAAPLRVYRPAALTNPGAALLWLHGGGLVVGSASQDDAAMGAMARELGILIASVDYRLAPEHPYPAPLNDCVAGLQWLHDQPAVDPGRIAVAGGSAGGGLAAAVAQVAHDRGDLPVAFQLLVYPMLDDRSATRQDVDETHFRLWSQRSNHFGWSSYLGALPGGPDITAPAAPGRRPDLTGLPPAWIGVGSYDLFRDEDVDYARRLSDAGVPCELEVVQGAFHGFDVVVKRSALSRTFRAMQVDAVRRGLGLT